MSGVNAPAPWRIAFDNARDPYTARNALGAEAVGAGGGGGGGFITSVTAPLSVTGGTLTIDLTDYVAKAGDTMTGFLTLNADPINLLHAATRQFVLGVGAAVESSSQPRDADLTAIAALTGTDTIYYRSGTSAWSAVTISTGLSFTGGVLTATGGGGGGTPGGSTTQVQYNNAGAFGGAANLTWNNTTSVLTLTGQLAINLGGATSILAAGIVESGGGFKQTGSIATLGPATTGAITLRPNGFASATGQVQINATGTVIVNGNIELGHATDTTLSRVSAGTVAIEGQNILTAATGVLKAGDTMTGALNVTPSSVDGMQVTGTTGQGRLIATGSSTNIGIQYSTKGNLGYTFYTNNFTNIQLSISHQTGAGYVVVSGGAGGNNIYLSDLSPITIYNANFASAATSVTPTAGDSSTKVATTAFVQGEIGGAWTAWTPTITAGTGTITSATVNFARYTRVGKTITATFNVTITDKGTGAGFLRISLPVVASASGGGAAFAREVASTGVGLLGTIIGSATTVVLTFYDGSTPITTGYQIHGVAIYEGV